MGCAAGAVVLAIALWQTGGLQTATMRAQQKPLPPGPTLDLDEAARELQPLAADPHIAELPQHVAVPQASPIGQRLNPVQVAIPQPSPVPRELTTTGEADRVAPQASVPSLLVPVAGVDPKTIVDTFDDVRSGHKHEALDIPAPRDTPVLAAAEGNVVKLFTSKEGGLTVYQFDDSRTYCYYYAHLDHYASGLREGTLLRPGQVLGYVGSTGNASAEAPHLHFAVFQLGADKSWWHGKPLDPLPMIQGR